MKYVLTGLSHSNSGWMDRSMTMAEYDKDPNVKFDVWCRPADSKLFDVWQWVKVELTLDEIMDIWNPEEYWELNTYDYYKNH